MYGYAVATSLLIINDDQTPLCVPICALSSVYERMERPQPLRKLTPYVNIHVRWVLEDVMTEIHVDCDEHAELAR